jgi:diacylglycerol kinase (ATP)
LNRSWRAGINSWNGLVAVTQSEMAFRQELVLFALAIPLLLFLAPDFTRRLALISTLVIVLVVELLNTAIEKIGDRITLEKDPAIGLSLLFAAAVRLWIAAVRFWF